MKLAFSKKTAVKLRSAAIVAMIASGLGMVSSSPALAATKHLDLCSWGNYRTSYTWHSATNPNVYQEVVVPTSQCWDFSAFPAGYFDVSGLYANDSRFWVGRYGWNANSNSRVYTYGVVTGSTRTNVGLTWQNL